MALCSCVSTKYDQLGGLWFRHFYFVTSWNIPSISLRSVKVERIFLSITFDSGMVGTLAGLRNKALLLSGLSCNVPCPLDSGSEPLAWALSTTPCNHARFPHRSASPRLLNTSCITLTITAIRPSQTTHMVFSITFALINVPAEH